jgi:hypothetical protein
MSNQQTGALSKREIVEKGANSVGELVGILRTDLIGRQTRSRSPHPVHQSSGPSRNGTRPQSPAAVPSGPTR